MVETRGTHEMKLPVQKTHLTLGIQTDRIDVVIPGWIFREDDSKVFKLTELTWGIGEPSSVREAERRWRCLENICSCQ